MSTKEEEQVDPTPAPTAKSVVEEPAAAGDSAVEATNSEEKKTSGANTTKDTTDTQLPGVSGLTAVQQDTPEAELAQEVRFLPDPVHKVYLCDATTEILPCLSENCVLELFLEQTPQSNLLPTNLLPFNPKAEVTKITASSSNEPYANGAHISGRPLHQNTFVLKDKDGQVVVLCNRDTNNNRERIFHLYGKTCLFEEDEEEEEEEDEEIPKEATHELEAEEAGKDEGKKDKKETTKSSFIVYDETDKEKKTPFYPWYRVSSYSKGNFTYRFVSVWNTTTKNYDPILKIKPMTFYTHTPRVGHEIKSAWETTWKYLSGTPHNETVVMTSIASSKNDPYAESSDEEVFGIISRQKSQERNGWRITLAPGMDPALGIVVAAIVADFPDFFCQEKNPQASKLS